jgi:TPR repeat protein
MRCLRCNADWNNGNIRPPLSHCPVCEANYTVEPSLKKYDNIAELLYELRINNSDVFNDSRRVLAYLNDYFPREEDIREELKALYERGLLDTIDGFLGGKISDDDVSTFVIENTTETLKSEILKLLQMVLGVNSDYGTDFNQSDYYRGILEKLNDDCYRIKALEKATVVDDDPSLKNQLIEFKIKTGDMEDAVKDLETAAAMGDSRSLYALAVMYKDGSYYQKDLDKAQGLLKMASEKGNSSADYLLAEMLLESGENKDEAIVYLRKAADNNVKAQCRLYRELYAKNVNEAVDYLKKAAFKGYAPAMYEYSLHLLYGDDVSQDVDSAIKFLEEAALRDDKDAISKLAYIYSVGFKVNKDMNKAKIYKEKLRED